MKKITAVAIAALFSFLLAAQDECSTMWPYLYKDFQEGTIYKKGGEKFVQQVNIHTLRGRLHYIDKGLVKEVISSDVLLVTIGDDTFMSVSGDMMKVVAKEEGGFIAALILGDFSKLNDTGGAYGTSTTNSATRKLSGIEIGGYVNQNHMELLQNRNNGEIVSLEKTYYLVTPDLTCKASRKDFEEALSPERKAEFKVWLKAHKIKWNDPRSLLGLVDFVSE